MTDQTPELLSFCPFCKSDDVHCCFGLGATYLVECQSCETSGPRKRDKPKAIEAWNTRPPSERPVAQMREALEKIANAPAMFPWARDLARKALTSERPSESADEREAASYREFERKLPRFAIPHGDVAAWTEEERHAIDSESAVAWQWRACISGRWGAWLKVDEPIERFREEQAEHLRDGIFEVRPLYAIPHGDAVRVQATSGESATACDHLTTEKAGWLLLPRALTAENGAKAALIGEFFVDHCYIDSRDEERTVEVPISWTTIKEIWKAAVAHFEAAPPASQVIANQENLLGSEPEPTLASERVSERETMISVPADRVIGELPSEQVEREPLTVTILKDVFDAIEHFHGRGGLDAVAEFARLKQRSRESNELMDRLEAVLAKMTPDESLVLKNDEQSGPVSSLQSQPSKE